MIKIAAVTGGNRGIGFQICKDLAEKHDFEVILCSRNIENGEEVAKKISGKVHVFNLDVSNEESIISFAENLKLKFSHLNVLVNNAAILPDSKSIIYADMSDIRKTIETNVYGPLLLSRELSPLLEKQDGRIINISSGMGALSGLDGTYAAYRLSKVSLNGLTIMQSKEFGKMGISVNAVCPGWVRTDMGGSSASRSVEKGAETPVWLATTNNIASGKLWRDKKIISW